MKNFTISEDEALEKLMDAALDRAPESMIPADFAARVAAKAMVLPRPSAVRETQYGRLMAFAATIVLAIALFLLAPHASPNVSNLGFQIEMLLLLQLAGIVYWLTRSKQVHL